MFLRNFRKYSNIKYQIIYIHSLKLTIAKNLILSDKLLLIQYSIRNVTCVGTVKSNDKTLNIKFSIFITCVFEYVSSVIYTNSPTSGG